MSTRAPTRYTTLVDHIFTVIVKSNTSDPFSISFTSNEQTLTTNEKG